MFLPKHRHEKRYIMFYSKS